MELGRIVRENVKNRLLTAVQNGTDGDEWTVYYYDTETQEISSVQKKEKTLISSKEILEEKHGYPRYALKKIIEEALPEERFPGRIVEVKPYGRRKYDDAMSDDPHKIYFSDDKSSIVWVWTRREDRHNIEFFIGQDRGEPKRDKQVFITNKLKRYKARTVRIDDVDELFRVKEDLEKRFGEGTDEEDITINVAQRYVQMMCEEKELYELAPDLFRVMSYKSNDARNEKEAEVILAHIIGNRALRDRIEIAKTVSTTGNDRKPKHYVLVTANEDESTTDELAKLGFGKKMRTEKRQERTARQELWDPLKLNNPSWVFSAFHPMHTPFDPEKPLEEQRVTSPSQFKSELNRNPRIRGFSLEAAIEDALKLYFKTTVTNDLEITGYKVGSHAITGRIAHSIITQRQGDRLVSELIMTREGWGQEAFKEKYKKNHPDVNLVFVEDEIDLIDKTYETVRRFHRVAGHNYKGFDYEHLIKYNNHEALLKNGKITKKQHDKILRILARRKEGSDEKGAERLFPVTRDRILDTWEYAKRGRINITQDNKLGTLSRLGKEISYKKIERNFRRRTFESLNDNIAYTISDGERSFKGVFEKCLEAAVLECISYNIPLQSVFNSGRPVVHAWRDSRRKYFMVQNTHKDRHDLFPREYLEKLQKRESPDKMVHQMMRGTDQIFGRIEGRAVFPDVMIRAFMPVIEADPVKIYMHHKLMTEQDPIVKNIYYSMLMDSLLVQIDKIRDAMERANLKFGEMHTPADYYESFDVADPDEKEAIYFREDGDLERSRESYMWTRSTGIDTEEIQVSMMLYDLTMLNYNNRVAEEINRFRTQNVLGKGKSLYVLGSGSDAGIPLSEGNGVFYNLQNDRFVGLIGSGAGETVLRQGLKYPSNKNFQKLISLGLNGTLTPKEANKLLAKIPRKEMSAQSNAELVRAITGMNMDGSGTINMAFQGQGYGQRTYALRDPPLRMPKNAHADGTLELF